MKKTTIAISIETKERLDKLGEKGDTYEKIVKRLLDYVTTDKTTKGFLGRIFQKR